MNHYLAVFTGSAQAMDRWMQLPESERAQRQAAGMAAWNRWAVDHAASIVDGGGPLSRTTLVSRDGIRDIRNAMAAYVIVRAASQAAAAQLFVDHPHFTLFPGEGVEVMAVLPVPQR
jgi:hypothetical protein